MRVLSDSSLGGRLYLDPLYEGRGTISAGPDWESDETVGLRPFPASPYVSLFVSTDLSDGLYSASADTRLKLALMQRKRKGSDGEHLQRLQMENEQREREHAKQGGRITMMGLSGN